MPRHSEKHQPEAESLRRNTEMRHPQQRGIGLDASACIRYPVVHRCVATLSGKLRVIRRRGKRTCVRLACRETSAPFGAGSMFANQSSTTKNGPSAPGRKSLEKTGGMPGVIHAKVWRDSVRLSSRSSYGKSHLHEMAGWWTYRTSKSHLRKRSSW